MNKLNHEENKFERVVVTNPLYTIFETKASISFKKGTEVQFSFDEISSIRIIKKENIIAPVLLMSVLVCIAGLCLVFFETSSIIHLAFISISFLCFILIFYVKKATYELRIDLKDSVRHKFVVKKELLADVKFFVKTIRETKRQNRKKSLNQ
jgi:hypothetical protein